MVCVRNKERIARTAHHGRQQGAAVELQQELLYEDRHTRRQGDKALFEVGQDNDDAPVEQLYAPEGCQQAVRAAHYKSADILVYQQIPGDRKSTRLNSSHANISYAVFCL